MPNQGPASQVPKTTADAIMAAHVSAISSNEKIFPLFARKLASRDTNDFVNTSRKLANWLSSEKAYYPAARPKIVELLEVAVSAYRDTFAHHSAIADLAQHLQNLVQAVVPFKHMFSENELQLRLQRVISDALQFLSRTPAGIALRIPEVNAPPQGRVPPNVPSSTYPVYVHLQPQILPAPDFHKSVWRIQPSPSSQSAAKVGPDGSAHAGLPQARDSPEVASSGQIEAIPSPVFPVTNAPQDSTENIPATAPLKPLPKRVRRAELLEEVIARDLDWFKSNQTLLVSNKDPDVPSSASSESSPALASVAPHVLVSTPPPKKKTARMVPSGRLPRRIAPAPAHEMESSISAPELPPTAEPLTDKNGTPESVQDGSIQMDVDEQNPSMGMMEHSAPISEASDAQQVPPSNDPPSPRPELVVLPSAESQVPQMDDRVLPVEPPPTDMDDKRILAPLSLPSPEIGSDRKESIEIDDPKSRSGSIPPEPPCKLESTPPQSPQMLQIPSPVLVPLVNALVPPLNLNFRIPPGQSRQLEIDTSRPRFDNEMTVIHSIQGKPFTHAHAIDISLSESIFSKISKWVKRRSHPHEAPQGVCISVACYRLPDIFAAMKSESEKRDVDALTLHSPCSWPSPNRLTLDVEDGERHVLITLSPPYFLTPDQCVDISSLMKSGENTLKIRQRDDLSEYLVVLHAHRPTRAQLAELDAVTAADERWRRLLHALAGRVVSEKTCGDAGPAQSVGVEVS